MKFNFSILILLLASMIYSCTNDANNDVTDPIVELQDSTDIQSSEILSDLDTTRKNHEVKEFKENLKVIEKKYGEQWGFCECVIANDSVNEALINLTNFEGSKFDKLMSRSDFITNKCQAFLSMDSNKTPEERYKHEQKVKKCLKNAKGK